MAGCPLPKKRYLTALRHLPVAVARCWSSSRRSSNGHRNSQASSTHSSSAAAAIGRSPWRALKLKEISYIHAESYAAGELKHGPLALVDKDMPVIAIARPTSCLKNSRATCRKSVPVAANSTSSPMPAPRSPSEGVYILHMPEHYGMLSPVLHVIPLQLLSYHAALVKGRMWTSRGTSRNR